MVLIVTLLNLIIETYIESTDHFRLEADICN
jgi:hypothetical protein